MQNTKRESDIRYITKLTEVTLKELRLLDDLVAVISIHGPQINGFGNLTALQQKIALWHEKLNTTSARIMSLASNNSGDRLRRTLSKISSKNLNSSRICSETNQILGKIRQAIYEEIQQINLILKSSLQGLRHPDVQAALLVVIEAKNELTARGYHLEHTAAQTQLCSIKKAHSRMQSALKELTKMFELAQSAIITTLRSIKIETTVDSESILQYQKDLEEIGLRYKEIIVTAALYNTDIIISTLYKTVPFLNKSIEERENKIQAIQEAILLEQAATKNEGRNNAQLKQQLDRIQAYDDQELQEAYSSLRPVSHEVFVLNTKEQAQHVLGDDYETLEQHIKKINKIIDKFVSAKLNQASLRDEAIEEAVDFFTHLPPMLRNIILDCLDQFSQRALCNMQTLLPRSPELRKAITRAIHYPSWPLEAERTLQVFSFLDKNSLLAARGVSTLWRQIATDDYLWKSFYIETSDSPANQGNYFYNYKNQQAVHLLNEYQKIIKQLYDLHRDNGNQGTSTVDSSIRLHYFKFAWDGERIISNVIAPRQSKVRGFSILPRYEKGYSRQSVLHSITEELKHIDFWEATIQETSTGYKLNVHSLDVGKLVHAIQQLKKEITELEEKRKLLSDWTLIS